jgi:hypothetical protein
MVEKHPREDRRLELLQRLDAIQSSLIAICTNDGGDTHAYEELRDQLLSDSEIAHLLPEFLRRHRTRSQFWSFIRERYAHYAERRNFVWDSFREVVNFVEQMERQPTSVPIEEALKVLDAEHVITLWRKALARVPRDPAGAITAARTLLESTCKLILDDHRVEYDNAADLPTLYRQVADRLNMSPSQHTEVVFKQILGGCKSVVEGLGALRNRAGDAHGHGRRGYEPEERHAALAVNLAGAVAAFLAETALLVRRKRDA